MAAPWRGQFGGDPMREVQAEESLLYLTDEQLGVGLDAMLVAHLALAGDSERILRTEGYGHAHRRALHVIARRPGTTVKNLMSVLAVTKQSLNRVLRALVADGLVESRVGAEDRRQRNLRLTAKGAALEGRLSEAQRRRMRDAYRAVGPGAVAGFRQVLEAMTDADFRRRRLRAGESGE